MTMYVIEDDDGEAISRYSYQFTGNIADAAIFDEPIAPAAYAKRYGGHVVELMENPEPVVVSEEEAEMLERPKDSYWPAHVFDCGAAGVPINSEDRLMRAYVNGWTVEKPKRYIVLMRLPGKKGPDDNVWHYMRAMRSQQGDYIWWSFADADGTCKSHRNDAFTAAEIEHYGLQDCERIPVAD